MITTQIPSYWWVVHRPALESEMSLDSFEFFISVVIWFTLFGICFGIVSFFQSPIWQDLAELAHHKVRRWVRKQMEKDR